MADEYVDVSSVNDIPEDVLKVQLRFGVEFQGTKYEYLKLRCPNLADMEVMQNEKLSEQKRIQEILTKIAVEPPMSPDSVKKLAFPDFILISKALSRSGFLGMTENTQNR